VAAAFFQDAVAACPKCRQRSFCLPNVKLGVDRKMLALINNIFDLYVQYANSEGFGIPMVEAAACGVPVMAVDYSAMSDVVRKLGGAPIDCRLELESVTGTYRAAPVGGDFVEKAARLLCETGPRRVARRRAVREAALRHYDWDATARTWADAIRSAAGREAGGGQWRTPPRYLPPPPPVPPQFPGHAALVRWALSEYLGRPELCTSYMEMRLVRDLNLGMRRPTFGATYQNEDSVAGQRTIFAGFTPAAMFQELDRMRDEWNARERQRAEAMGLPT
jgi:hypothetical protein